MEIEVANGMNFRNRLKYSSRGDGSIFRVRHLGKKHYELVASLAADGVQPRTHFTRRFATDCRSLSPTGCPKESLMCLNPSKSKNRTATFFWRRG